jgi:feruloyl esterase
MRSFTASCFAGAALAALLALPLQAKAGPAAQCAKLAKTTWPGLEITATRVVPAAPAGTVPIRPNGPSDKVNAPLPQYCRVEGMLDRRKGADGEDYGLGFALALPSGWNGRFVYQGGGGFNGHLNEPFGIESSGTPALARGFAVVATDGGHRGGWIAFLSDQQAALDFAFNAVPSVTRLGQSLATQYYGRAPHHTYGVGCSTGGREGMLAAQRYPLLFDGVIAGAPAMKVWHSQLAAWNAAVAFNRIAPKDAVGNLLPREALSAADQQLLHGAIAKQCDALDGLSDGYVNNIAACHFDPGVLQCGGEKTASCLSPGQVGALRIAFQGPRGRDGRNVTSGFPYDLGLLGEHVGNPASLLPSGVPGQFGPPPDPLVLDIDREIARVRDHPIATLTDTWRWTDLDTFNRRGGKILFFHGAADPWFSFYDTLDYFERLGTANPGADFSRFYAIPGMGHCGDGGTNVFDLLDPLVDWVENGVAPQSIAATSKVQPGVSRPLCPWPQYARYKGAGDANRAESFECASDE